MSYNPSSRVNGQEGPAGTATSTDWQAQARGGRYAWRLGRSPGIHAHASCTQDPPIAAHLSLFPRLLQSALAAVDRVESCISRKYKYKSECTSFLHCIVTLHKPFVTVSLPLHTIYTCCCTFQDGSLQARSWRCRTFQRYCYCNTSAGPLLEAEQWRPLLLSGLQREQHPDQLYWYDGRLEFGW